MLQAFADRRVVRLPDDRAECDRMKVDIASTQFDLDAILPPGMHCKHAPALLVLLGVSFVKDDSVAGFQRRCHFSGNDNAHPRHVDDLAGTSSSRLGKPRRDQSLVIRPHRETHA